MKTPTEWREESGTTLASLAAHLKRSQRSLIRYFAEERAWPFDVVIALKKLSGNALTDESFARAGTTAASPTRAHKRLSICKTRSDQTGKLARSSATKA